MTFRVTREVLRRASPAQDDNTSNARLLPLHRHADERAVAQSKPPRKFLRPADSDTRIGYNLNRVVRPGAEAMLRVYAKIHLMVTFRDIERLGQFPRTGAKPPNVFDSSPFAHEREPAPRLDRTDKNEPIARAALDEHIQHPVHAVVEIDVGGARLVPRHERARARPAESVTSFVAFHKIRLGLDNQPCAFSPNKLSADQVAGAVEWITLEKRIQQHAVNVSSFDERANRSEATAAVAEVVLDPDVASHLKTAINRFAIAKTWNEFGA